MKKIVFLALIFASPAFAEESDTYTINVRAQIVSIMDEDSCKRNPDLEGCENITVAPEIKHYCEDHPDAIGCKYYEGNKNG